MISLEHYQGKDADYVRAGQLALAQMMAEGQEETLSRMRSYLTIKAGRRGVWIALEYLQWQSRHRLWSPYYATRQRRCIVIYAARYWQINRAADRLLGKE